MNVRILKDDWLRYCESVGDFNPVHSSLDVAKLNGLDDVIAPGMYVASFIERDGRVSSVRKVSFSDKVYDLTDLEVVKKDRKGLVDYCFFDDSKKVCDVKGVEFGDFVDREFSSGTSSLDFNYIFDFDFSKMSEFLAVYGNETLGESNMYLASLSAPALLSYGKSKGFIGFHGSQSFERYSQKLKEGPLEVWVCDEQRKSFRGSDILSYNLIWFQDNNVLASGKSVVFPLKS